MCKKIKFKGSVLKISSCCSLNARWQLQLSQSKPVIGNWLHNKQSKRQDYNNNQDNDSSQCTVLDKNKRKNKNRLPIWNLQLSFLILDENISWRIIAIQFLWNIVNWPSITIICTIRFISNSDKCLKAISNRLITVWNIKSRKNSEKFPIFGYFTEFSF